MRRSRTRYDDELYRDDTSRDRQHGVVAARSVALYRPILEGFGLRHPQYLVMLALWQHAPLSVKRLEAAHLVTRRRDHHDERLLTVELTEQGAALRTKALQVPTAVIHRLGMTVPELQAMHASLTRLIAAAEPITEHPATHRHEKNGHS